MKRGFTFPLITAFLGLLYSSILPYDDLWAKTLTIPGITNLRCNFLREPQATLIPIRLSWEYSEERIGATQYAYRILVSRNISNLSRDQGEVWDSGKVISDLCTGILFQGQTLIPSTRYFWKVMVWNDLDIPQNWSEITFWQTPPKDWQAQWVTVPTSSSSKFHPHNGYHSALALSNADPKWVILDLGTQKKLDSISLYPARPIDWIRDEPGFLFPVRFKIEISDQANFESKTLLTDQTSGDFINPGNTPVVFNFPPVEGRFLRLFVTKLAVRNENIHAFALAEMEASYQKTPVSYHAKVTAKDSIESGLWSLRNLCDGDLTSHAGSERQKSTSLPVFRKFFKAPEQFHRATIHASALGVYEVFLNGQKVGKQILAPEWTNYSKRLQYQTYDVTDLLKPGENEIQIETGNGWFLGRIGADLKAFGTAFSIPPEAPIVFLQLDWFFDGKKIKTLSTDDTWEVSEDGPILVADIYDGQTVDNRKHPSNWKNVEVKNVPLNLFVPQVNEPIIQTMELSAKSLISPFPGTWIYDLGQNMVGTVRLKVQDITSGTITLRYGEFLQEDGSLYTENLRGALQTDRFIPNGPEEQFFEPRFTYHGFRYVEIKGLVSTPNLKDLTGIVFHSGALETGHLTTSSKDLNKLFENILWTQKGNLMGVPTDCPQRDERFGWMGDIQVFGQTAMFNMDLAVFFEKWFADIRDAQKPEGVMPDFTPITSSSTQNFGAPGWGDAGALLPWNVYVQYGDKEVLKSQYHSAKAWVDWVKVNNPDFIWENKKGVDYGDWLNGDTVSRLGWPTQGAKVPSEIFATAFYARSALSVSKMAKALEYFKDANEYQQLFEKIKEAFCTRFLGDDGIIFGDTQAGYALALYSDLIPEDRKPLVFSRLLDNLSKYNFKLSTGIQTTKLLILTLVNHGRSDLAERLVTSREFPSWLFAVDNGATTIWERWDGFVPGRGFQNPSMNSFNHWAFGSVGEWYYRVLLGLSPDEDYPGYRRFTIHPKPADAVNYVSGSFKSVRGLIKIEWTRTNETFKLNVHIPTGTQARIFLPTRSVDRIFVSGKNVFSAPGISEIENAGNEISLTAFSGTFHFEIRK